MNIPPAPPQMLRPTPVRSRGVKAGWTLVAILFVVFAVIALWSCGKGSYHNYCLSSAAAEHFHQQLDRGDFESIHEDASDEFRRAGSHADAIKFLETVHVKMGNSGKMSIKGFHMHWSNRRIFVDQVYDTQFTLGQGRESFIWMIEQDEPRLYSYRIDSPNLR
jgi:hypothetical protein